MNNVMFIHNTLIKNAPSDSHPRLQRPSYSYPTSFSASYYLLLAHNLEKSKFRISIRVALLRNNFLGRTEKFSETMSLFYSKVKNKLLVIENEAKYFNNLLIEVLSRKQCLNSTQGVSVPFIRDLIIRSIWSSTSPFPTNLDQTKPCLTLFKYVLLSILLLETDLGPY